MQAKERELTNARDQFRGIAVRGAAIFEALSDMSSVSSVYIMSLPRFMIIFEKALKDTPRDGVLERRVQDVVEHLTFSAFRVVVRGMFESHRRVFCLMLAFRIQLRERKCRAEEFSVFARGGAGIEENSVRRKPFEWFPLSAWLNVMAAVAGGVEGVRELPDLIARNDHGWRQWMDAEQPETMNLPDGLDARLTSFQRLLVVRCLRLDRLLPAITAYVMEALGKRYGDPQNINWDLLCSESTPQIPVLCLLTPGVDPTSEVESLAKRQKTHMRIIAMGDGQEEATVLKALNTACSDGHWVLLQNGHLAPHALAAIDNFLDTLSDDTNEDFRLFITVQPHPSLPSALVQRCIKVATDVPAGIRSALSRTLEWVGDEGLYDAMGTQIWRSAVFAVVFVHCVVRERCRFGAAGWTVPYEFTFTDLGSSLTFLQSHISAQEAQSKQRGSSSITWQTVRTMMTEIFYGGRIVSHYDQSVLAAYCTRWLHDGLARPGFVLHDSYRVPTGVELPAILNHVNQLPAEDTPELFGMFPSADIGGRTQRAQELLQSVSVFQAAIAAQPSKVREASLMEQLDDLIGKLPQLLEPDKLHERLDKHGARRPLFGVLRSEYEQLQLMVTTVRKTVMVALRSYVIRLMFAQDIKFMLQGTLVPTPALSSIVSALQTLDVPAEWQSLSWPLSALGVWSQRLHAHADQLAVWLEKGYIYLT